jgi:hypothetical protein
MQRLGALGGTGHSARDGGGWCEVEEEVEGRERVKRMLVGDIGMAMGNIGSHCLMVGVKRPTPRALAQRWARKGSLAAVERRDLWYDERYLMIVKKS